MAHQNLPQSRDPVQTGCYLDFPYICPIRFYIHPALYLSVHVPSAENVEYETLLHKTQAALQKQTICPYCTGSGCLNNERNKKTILKLWFSSCRWENQHEYGEEAVPVDLVLRSALVSVSPPGLGEVRPRALRPLLLSRLGPNENRGLLFRHLHVLLQPHHPNSRHHRQLLRHRHQPLLHPQKVAEEQQPSAQHRQAPSKALDSKRFPPWREVIMDSLTSALCLLHHLDISAICPYRRATFNLQSSFVFSFFNRWRIRELFQPFIIYFLKYSGWLSNIFKLSLSKCVVYVKIQYLLILAC